VREPVEKNRGQTEVTLVVSREKWEAFRMSSVIGWRVMPGRLQPSNSTLRKETECGHPVPLRSVETY
jgi:hypothetical protein